LRSIQLYPTRPMSSTPGWESVLAAVLTTTVVCLPLINALLRKSGSILISRRFFPSALLWLSHIGILVGYLLLLRPLDWSARRMRDIGWWCLLMKKHLIRINPS